MEQLQVLVATMHQKDLSLGEKMNIRCHAVFANAKHLRSQLQGQPRNGSR